MALTKIKTSGIADNAITNAKMADDAIDSADFANASIDNIHVATGLDAVKLADGTVTNTEFQYINTLSSNAQTQISAKSPTAGNASLVTVGTIGTGVWNGTPITSAYLNPAQTAITSLGTLTSLTSSGDITTDGIFKVDSAPDSDVIVFDQSGRKEAIKTTFSATAMLSTMVFKTSTGATDGSMDDALTLKGNKATFAGDIVGNARLQISKDGDGEFVGEIFNGHSTGHGLKIRGGSSGSQYALYVADYNQTNSLFYVMGDGAATFAGNIDGVTQTLTSTSEYSNSGLVESATFRVRNNHDGYGSNIATFQGDNTGAGGLYLSIFPHSSTYMGIQAREGATAGAVQNLKIQPAGGTTAFGGAVTTGGALYVNSSDLTLDGSNYKSELILHTDDGGSMRSGVWMRGGSVSSGVYQANLFMRAFRGGDYKPWSDATDYDSAIWTTTSSSNYGSLWFGTRGTQALKIDTSQNATFYGDLLFDNSSRSIGNSTNRVHHMYMRQGGAISFGDSTNTNPIGITEGEWNSYGTDNDRMSIYFRSTMKFYGYPGGTTLALTMSASGAVAVAGAFSKGSGSFKIDHPLPSKKDTHHLVHSFTESPRADLIYRDKVTLVDGSATVNIDTVAGMTDGTFVLLCDDVQCFTSNESDWKAVKGSVAGNILTIECEDSNSTADISWMVIGDRKDKHIMETDWTDENGKPIVEPEKENA